MNKDAFVETYFRHFEVIHQNHVKNALDPDAELLAVYREKRVKDAPPEELVPVAREIVNRMQPPYQPLNPAEEADEDIVFEFIDSIESGGNIADLWRTVMLLIERAPTDEALAFVAASTLEDLIRMHGKAVIEFVEADYPRSARLRTALTGVWTGPGDSDVWLRVLALMDELPPEKHVN